MKITILKKNHREFVKRLDKWGADCDKYNIKHTAEFIGEYKTTNNYYSIDLEEWDINFTLPNNGIKYLGNIKYIDAKPFVFNKSDINILSYNKGATDVCNHCNTTRSRNCYYYFLDTVNDKVIKVGSTCVCAYIGYNLSTISTFVEEYGSLDDDIKLPSKSDSYNIKSFLTILTASSKNYMKPYDKQNTIEDFESYQKCYKKNLTDIYSHDFNKVKEMNNVVIPEDLNIKVYDYWSNQYGDFANNVMSLLFEANSNKFVESFKINYFKIAACGILKAMTKKENNLATGGHVGNIKDRLDFVAKVEDIKIYDSNYGDIAYIHLLTKDDNKLLVKTNTTTSFYNKAINNKDKEISFKGTVSKHDIRNNVKITVLQRCK